jgi:16S rRNA (guanine527-N7)-methyltransferase
MSIREKLSPYFTFTEVQWEQFQKLEEVILDWNQRVNVVSRKDTSEFVERHVLHSLSIFKFLPFTPKSQVLDLGTGGGFPGLPLAIANPETEFLLVDSIGKKIMVVNEAIEFIGLTNVKTLHGRAESVKAQFDFVVSRAVAPAEELLMWTKGKYKKAGQNGVPNGLICLKGGDLKEELKSLKKHAELFEISSYFPQEFFETKKLVYIPQ